MPDFQGPEKLLRGMQFSKNIASANGVSVYELIHAASGLRFVLKHIAIPASEEKLEALILSGAYADREEADSYYRRVGEELIAEIRVNRSFSECPNILRFLSYQLVLREDRVGCDLYTITAHQESLLEYRSKNAMSHLTALNLGIDLCTALEAIHEAGYIFLDLRPGNVFRTESGRFLLGDFGLASMQDMQFSSLPEQYRSEYSAPELGDVLTGLNKTVDIYSLGMLLYRIYNGYHAPFEDESTGAGASEERRRSGEALPAPIYADYELAAILGKACAFKPEDRYQTPAEFREALSDYMIRNSADDSLIVPPLVTGDAPLLEEAAAEEPEPVRFANVEELSDDFKTHFKPDTAGLAAVISAVREEEARTAKRTQPAEAEKALAEEPTQPAPAEDKPKFIKEKKKPEKAKKAPAEKTPADETKAAAKQAPSPVKQQPGKKKRFRRMRRRNRPLLWIGIGLLALLAAAVLLYCFTPLGHNWYEFDIVVDRFEVVEADEDSITVEVASNAKPGQLTAQCQDAYGNAISKAVGTEPITFEALTPGTQYTVNLALEGFHRLSGQTSVTLATLSKTEVLTFAVSPGQEEGVAAVTLVVKDGNTEPEEWTLSYEARGEETQTQTFSGHSAQITGLTVGKEYTFRLVEGEDYALSGQLETTYTPLAVITAESLELANLVSGTATLRWRCTSQLPESWNLSCEGEDGEEHTQIVPQEAIEPEADGSYLCSAEFAGVSIGETYVFRLGADGMFQSLSFTLDDTVPYVYSFTAEAGDGRIDLTWESSFVPASGWILQILPGGSEAQSFRTVVTDTKYTLEYNSTDSEQPTLLPNTDFRFVLSIDGETPLLGQTETEARSGRASSFSGLSVDIMNGHTGLYKTPDREDWDADDLMDYSARASFNASDSIEILLRNRSGVKESDSEVSILVIVRDAEGKLVGYSFDRKIWNDLWTRRNCAIHLPFTPQEPGNYTVEVYFDWKIVRTMEFNIVA